MSFHFFHRWSRWRTVEEGELTREHRYLPDQTRVVGAYLLQERVCATCGYAQRKLTRII